MHFKMTHCHNITHPAVLVGVNLFFLLCEIAVVEGTSDQVEQYWCSFQSLCDDSWSYKKLLHEVEHQKCVTKCRSVWRSGINHSGSLVTLADMISGKSDPLVAEIIGISRESMLTYSRWASQIIHPFLQTPHLFFNLFFSFQMDCVEIQIDVLRLRFSWCLYLSASQNKQFYCIVIHL